MRVFCACRRCKTKTKATILIFVAFFAIAIWLCRLHFPLKDCRNNSPSLVKRLHRALEWQNSDGERYFYKAIFNGSSYLSRIDSPSCGITEVPDVKTDIQMSGFFKTARYVSPSYYYNKNGWSSEKKLTVIVVPHSHNDPGWRKTFEEYYFQLTQYVMNGIIKKLGVDSRRKFILSEVCTLAHWWDQVGDDQRKIMKSYLQKGQLEIVSGGWVMPDEATVHYSSMLDQFVEGHQWLRDHLGYTPRNGWAVDPFGHSATLAYLSSRMDIKNMVINRIHHLSKTVFASNKWLNFHWRQMWDSKNSTDVSCHVLPYHYTVLSCGPNHAICCQFDFSKLPGARKGCGWSGNSGPRVITEENVEERAKTLLDQYRKLSQLFQSDVVLVPLGGDFYFNKIIEWDNQFINYQKLFDYLNDNEDLHVHAQFGTLKDYFEAVEKNLGAPDTLPTLSGDFMPYSDEDPDFWSGYYTTRPHFKRIVRMLEYHQRAGEILFSWALLKPRAGGSIPDLRDLAGKLVAARRSLGFFQHHDAITGTSRKHVLTDYYKRAWTSLQDLQKIICKSAAHLLQPQTDILEFTLDEHMPSHNSLPRKSVIDICKDVIKIVTFYNSLPQQRQELITLLVTFSRICVQNYNGIIVPTQIIPIWNEDNTISDELYEVAFVVDVPALGLASYMITNADYTNAKMSCCSTSSVTVYNSDNKNNSLHFTVQNGGLSPFVLESSNIVAKFSSDGLLQEIKDKNSGLSTLAKIGFFMYGTDVDSAHRSGPYLFVPDKPATPIVIQKPHFRVISGPLLSQVEMLLPFVNHKIILKNSPGVDGYGVDIVNVVDISKENDKEIMMRLETDVKNEDTFYTDQNGFQMVKRRFLDNIPFQGNFYPITTTAFIEDENKRLSLITGHSVGCSSLQPGWLEIILDRRFTDDDRRGLGEGVLDNEKSIGNFRILLEKRSCGDKCKSKDSNQGFASLVGNLAVNSLLHPMLHLIAAGTSSFPSPRVYGQLVKDLPCDINLLNLRTVISQSDDGRFTLQNSTSLFLHRIGFDCRIFTPANKCGLTSGKVTLGEHFSHAYKSVTETSISLLNDKYNFSMKSEQRIPVMEIVAYKMFA